jgi:hypothetical protein
MRAIGRGWQERRVVDNRPDMPAPRTRTSPSALRSIPGVGRSIARDLEDLGIHRVSQLRGRSSEAMYEALCERRGRQDRCLLYVFRCAVYFASRKRHDPELLKWWNWKDAAGPAGRARARAR